MSILSLWESFKIASKSKTANVVVLLLIVAAIPLTIYVSQQSQDTRQRAAGSCEESCYNNYPSKLNKCKQSYDDCDSQPASVLSDCKNVCDRIHDENHYERTDSDRETCKHECFSSYLRDNKHKECTEENIACDINADTESKNCASSCIGNCEDKGSNAVGWCQAKHGPRSDCSGGSGGPFGDGCTTSPEEGTYVCSSVGGAGANRGGCTMNGKSCVKYATWVSKSSFNEDICKDECREPCTGSGENGGGSTGSGGSSGPTCGASGSLPTGSLGDKQYICDKTQKCPFDNSVGVGVPMVCQGDGQWANFNPAGECTSSCKPGTGASGTGTGDSGSNTPKDNPVPPPAGYIWKLQSKTCQDFDNHTDCPKNDFDQSNVDPNSSRWCHDFSGGSRCLMLVRNACQKASDSACFANGGISCNYNEISLSANPTTVKKGEKITFTISGNASTYPSETKTGIESCGNMQINGSGGSIQCTAKNSGSFTHTWKHCVGDISHCSPVCSKTATFTVSGDKTSTNTNMNTETTTPKTTTNSTITSSTTNSFATPTPRTVTQNSFSTSTPAITQAPTPKSQAVTFSFKLELYGIVANRPNDPAHPNRKVTITLIDAEKTERTKEGTVVYSRTTGKFEGKIDMGTINTGSYTVKAKVPNYLSKTNDSLITITADKTLYELSQITLIGGDFNNDNKIDLLDYNILLGCFGNNADTASCQNKDGADLDDNGVVDGVDYNIFVKSVSLAASGE